MLALLKVGLSWVLYWLGDLASKPLHWELANSYWWAGFWYPIYNSLMCASVELQGDDKRGPWSEEQDSTSELSQSQD